MNLKKQIRPGASKHAVIVVRAFVVWLVSCLGGALVTAYLIDRKVIPLEALGYGVALTLLVSSFAASALMISGIGEKRLLVSGACALGIIAVLTLCNLVLIGGGVHGFLVTMLVVSAGCFAAALIKAKPKKKYKFLPGKY